MLFVLLFGIFVAYKIQAYLFKKFWNKNLSAKIQFTDPYIYEGESSSLKEVVINDKSLPLPAVSVRFALSRNLELKHGGQENSTTTDQTYRRDIFSFLFHQQITRTLPFVGKRRGYYEINDTEITASDLFFHKTMQMHIKQASQMYVFPAPVNVDRIHNICRAISGMILTQNRLHPDPFEFSGIREYRKEDPMNHINWKASARTGSLMVNQFASTTNIELTMLFDLEDRYILKYPELLEETIRIVSSLAAKLAAAKMPLTVKGNVYERDTKNPFQEYLPSGGSKMSDLNQKLACVDSEDIAYTFESLLEKEANQTTGDHTYILISKNSTPQIIEQIQQLISHNNHILWIIPMTNQEQEIPCSMPSLEIIRWEVE